MVGLPSLPQAARLNFVVSAQATLLEAFVNIQQSYW